MAYSIQQIHEIIGGEFFQQARGGANKGQEGVRAVNVASPAGSTLIENLLLDSRRLIFPSTSLFFALKGPRRDGSRFVEELYRRGVRNFVLQGSPAEAPDQSTGKPARSAATPARSAATPARSAATPAKSTGASVHPVTAPAQSTGASVHPVTAPAQSAAAIPGHPDGSHSSLPDANILIVPDTLAALQRLAAFHRQQFTIPVIGITGSNGKTTVKEWLNQLLEDSFHIVRSPKSYNSQIGVPLSVWQLQPAHQLAIFEAGISRRGEMQRLQPIIRPSIGIFTNIGEAHSEGFDDIAQKAAEKLQLFNEAETLIYNIDQPETRKAVEAWSEAGSGRLAAQEARGAWSAGHQATPDSGQNAGTGVGPNAGTGPALLSWGKSADASIKLINTVKSEGWTTLTFSFEGNTFDFSIPFTDEAALENAGHCIATLLYLKQPVEKIAASLKLLSPIAMRLELKAGINHCSVINDSYSADLSSLSIALDFLAQQQQHARRTVILSDILQSGREEQQLYVEVAMALGQKKVDRLIGIGERISANAEAFSRWFPGQAVFYPSVEAFQKDVHRLHFRDETILIKGARVFEFEAIDRLLTEKIHQTIMEVNLGAMASNLSQYRQVLQPATRLMAMVKAYGYGTGSFEIANLLQFHGVDYLGVAYADEGVTLRKAGISMPIMVMNTENSSFDSLVEYNLEPVVYSLTLFKALDKWLKREGVPVLPVHIELETGMHRLGLTPEELTEALALLPTSVFKVQSAFSHFAASEDPGQDPFSQRQTEIYKQGIARLEQTLGYSFIRHIANSAGIIRHPEYQFDMVRLGIGLYGIDSANTHRLDLQEVSTLKTTIAQIKHLTEGDTVGYNRRGLGHEGTVTATVRIGYADGYSRRLGNGVGKMWINGHLAPTIGIVSMDMTMIDITGIPDVHENDEVIVFGKELSVSKLADWSGTIPYEILTGVSPRVKRVYFEE